MPQGFDYSKWDKLELSDDEDPDPGSKFIEESFLRRIKHEQHEHKTEAYKSEKSKLETREEEARKLAEKAKAEAAKAQDEEERKRKAKQAEALDSELQEIASTSEKLDRERKFNAEEFCQDAWSRTLIGKDAQPDGTSAAELDPVTMRYETYVAKYKAQMDDIITLAVTRNPGLEECQELFRENTWLLSQSGMGYVLLEALNLGMKDKFKSMKKVCRVLFHVKSILDYAEAQKLGPRDVARGFFKRLLDDEAILDDYWKTFDDFFSKLRDRSQQKKEEEMGGGGVADDEEELEEIPREERLGPGGLDPVEVFPTLPEGMQDAYQSGDPQALRDFVSSLSMEDARYHMRRMVDSGLWVPAPGEDPGAALRGGAGS